MNKLMLASLIALTLLVAGCIIPPDKEPIVDDSEFLKQKCDAVNSCPEGFECAAFPGIGLKCFPAEKKPCSFVKCFSGKECVVLETYPVQVTCS
jgi:hypothetical protein